MGKIRPGNKQNSALNGEYVTHVRKRNGGKKITSGLRRTKEKVEIREGVEEDARKFEEMEYDDFWWMDFDDEHID